MAETNLCRCIGRPLRFVAGECFTCGRFTVLELNAAERFELARPGLGALAEAVARTRSSLRTAVPAPRHGRRVVIEPPPAPATAPAGVKRHGGRRTKPRSPEVRAVELLTRTF